MAEMKSPAKAETASPTEAAQDERRGLLEHSREFLDFFWDIAKPEQETRLQATEKLLEYLRTRPSGSEMNYALKRLITGLGVGRETARPCYSLALAQLLQSFEDIPLCSILDQVQEKYNLQTVNKGMRRPAVFANLFGVLALFQSGRLVKDQEALMKSVKLLKILSHHYNHLQGQPVKVLVDILSQVPESMFQEILPKILKGGDLKVVLSSPKHLELFLLAQQRVPAKLESLMGSVDLFSEENIPSLVNVLKTAANSVRKEHILPEVALDLLRLALKENKFTLFWKEVLEQRLLNKPCWSASYMCFRLLGASLPLLSEEQLRLVMRGDLIRHFGEHMVISKPQNLFKIIPEISTYVSTFLEGCQDDPKRQFAMMVAFTSITNQGLPVMPTFWRVTRVLSSEAVQSYVAWLRDMFLQPDLDSLVDFSTANQKRVQDASLTVPERSVFRLRKWIIHRLVSLVEHLHLEKDDAVIEQVARFCFFHAFFKTKKATPQIPETKQHFSFPLDDRNRSVNIGAFFSLLQTLSMKFRQTPDLDESGKPWAYRLVQLADMLLNHSRNVTIVTPFTAQQRQAWDQMMSTLKELEARSSETRAVAFQHLLLLVGLHLFKSPTESCDVLSDIQTCIKKSTEQNPRRSRSRAKAPQEPAWVEVMVEILLSLLAQPSNLMRKVVRNVFGHICSHLTPRGLQLILAVLNPETNEDEDDNVVVTDDNNEKQPKHGEDEDSDSEDNKNSDSDVDSEDGAESEEEDRDKDVDPGFRQQLMEVLQAGNALGGVDSEEEEEELGDEAMMALDQNLASLFAEQKLRIRARQEEKNKLQKEKQLRRDFQIRVLDLIEVLVTKQPEHPLILELLEPLLSIIQRSMRSKGSTKQEQDLLHKTARIFMHHLCRARHYCHEVGPCAKSLLAQVERLVQQAGNQADASLALYYFNASLYLLRVLKGNTAKRYQDGQNLPEAEPKDSEVQTANCLDLDFVTRVYSAALESFLTKRNSPLTVPMFLSLFSRYPVICKNLLPILVQHVAGPLRPRHQAQACLLLQKTLSARELRVCFEDPEWEQLIGQVLGKVTQTLQTLGEAQSKGEQQREFSALELLNVLFKTVNHEKLSVDLTSVLGLLQSKQQKLQQSLQQGNHSSGSNRLYDLYWQAMKMLGVQRPKSEKKNVKDIPSDSQSPVSMKRKKKGFLPETKKRKKLKSEDTTPGKDATSGQDVVSADATPAAGEGQPPSTGKKKRKRAKASTPSQVNGAPVTKSPAPNNPTLSPSTPFKSPKLQKKKEKLSQVNGATPVSPIEPEGKKHHQKALPTKEVLRKSPQSALPRKRARLSLVSRSPSLLQSGVKKRKVARRKVQTP